MNNCQDRNSEATSVSTSKRKIGCFHLPKLPIPKFFRKESSEVSGKNYLFLQDILTLKSINSYNLYSEIPIYVISLTDLPNPQDIKKLENNENKTATFDVIEDDDKTSNKTNITNTTTTT